MAKSLKPKKGLEVKIIAGKFSDNSTINLEDGMVHYFTTQETTTANPNFKFNS